MGLDEGRVRRKADNEFKPVQSQKYGAVVTEWFGWEAQSKGVSIVHQLSSVEQCVGHRQVFALQQTLSTSFKVAFGMVTKCRLNNNEFNAVRNTSCADLRMETNEKFRTCQRWWI